MPEADLIDLFAEPLNRLGVRYMISGSVAAMLYGEPRVTHDIDLIVFLRPDQATQLPAVFPGDQFYLPPLDIILGEMRRESRGHFNLIHISSGLKADFYMANRDELHAWAFRNAKEYSLEGKRFTLAPPEYVILWKLEFFREGGSEKHLRDIRSMRAISGNKLDEQALNDWLQRRNLETEWRRVIGEKA
jgi:hypothetical protein